MSRTAVVYPTEEELQAKSVGELNLYIRRIHAQLGYLNTGPVHKALVKQLEMAERVRQMRRSVDRGDEA